MTETQFIEKNKADWAELEELLGQVTKDPERLQYLFVKVSSDLAYASTFYPQRIVKVYLNDLTKRVFAIINLHKKRNLIEDLKTFYSRTLPSEIIKNKYAFLTSLLVFVIAAIIGVISSIGDDNFVNIILGENYVSMTDENIGKGDPMAVYKSGTGIESTLHITINNIQVAFFAFLLGLIGSMGTYLILVYNGIMVGAFQYYFVQKGLFKTSFLTIWLHGTIEISAIIVAGAAGIILGNGLLRTHTYRTSTSIKIAARKSVRIIFSTVPFFIIAGMIEGFITRLTEMPDSLKITIILISGCLITFTYIIYPFFIYRGEVDHSENIIPSESMEISYERFEVRKFTESLVQSLAQLKDFVPIFFSSKMIPLYALHIISLSQLDLNYLQEDSDSLQLLILWLMISYLILMINMRFVTHDRTWAAVGKFIRRHGPRVLLVTLFLILYFVLPFILSILLFLALPPHFFLNIISSWIYNEDGQIPNLEEVYRMSFEKYILYILVLIFLFIIYGITTLGLHYSSISSVLWSFFSWHLAEENMFGIAYLQYTISLMINLVLYGYFIFYCINHYFSIMNQKQSIDLHNKFQEMTKSIEA